MGQLAAATHRQRMDELGQELRKQGVRGREFAPPMWRLAWRMGLQVRPPLYQPIWLLAIVWGVPYGVTLWLLFWLASVTLGWEMQSVAFVVFMGAFWGVAMAWWMKSRFRNVTLPPLHQATTGKAIG